MKLHNLIEVHCEVCECKVKKRRLLKHILTTKHLENLKGEQLKCVLGWSILEIMFLFLFCLWNLRVQFICMVDGRVGRIKD